MKKEQLTLMFPEIGETAITALPDDLVVCWYPSSGVGISEEVHLGETESFSGYNIIKHWQEQPSKLKPNLFIFSDIEEFEIPPTYDLFFSMDINKDLNFEKEELPPVDYNKHNDSYLSELFLSIDIEIYEQKKAEIEKRYLEQLGKIQLIKKENVFILLVRCENEEVYQRFILNKIKVPLLTLNRPMDNFIFNYGINLEELGVQDFIAGKSYVSGLRVCNQFKIYPDFIFRCFEGIYHHLDLANLYSRVKINKQ
jgi:hypothetical protein